jgi:hypothetical protein
VNLDGVAMDVFGIILYKSNKKIYGDLSGRNKLSNFEAWNNFKPQLTSNAAQKLKKDYSSLSRWKVMAKLLMGKY